jgi:hypothetical protein
VVTQSAEKYKGHSNTLAPAKKPIAEKIEEEEDKYSDDENAFINEEEYNKPAQ